MQNPTDIPRREFLAASAAGLSLTGGLAHGAEPATTKLAVDGGEKAVTAAFTQPPRFGAPERERLDQMLGQDTLFYWKGPQTGIFTERFQQVCPMKYVMTCSQHGGTSGRGGGHAPATRITAPVMTSHGHCVIYQMGAGFRGLEPVYIKPHPADVEKRITSKTKAIIAVHLAGNPRELMR